MLNRTHYLYIGTDLTLSCSVELDPSVNNNEIISKEWSVEAGDRYTLELDVLTISPLVRNDSWFSCTGIVTGIDNGPSVISSNDISIEVKGKM